MHSKKKGFIQMGSYKTLHGIFSSEGVLPTDKSFSSGTSVYKVDLDEIRKPQKDAFH